MFIKAYASGGAGGQAGVQRNINRQLGIGRTNSQSAFYRRVGTSGMGGNRRTRGRQATITPVRGR